MSLRFFFKAFMKINQTSIPEIPITSLLFHDTQNYHIMTYDTILSTLHHGKKPYNQSWYTTIP